MIVKFEADEKLTAQGRSGDWAKKLQNMPRGLHCGRQKKIQSWLKTAVDKLRISRVEIFESVCLRTSDGFGQKQRSSHVGFMFLISWKTGSVCIRCVTIGGISMGWKTNNRETHYG